MNLFALARILFVTAMLCVCQPSANAGNTLETVLKRGELIVGVNTNLPGFAMKSPDGRWSGFDIDMARAVAAAMLGSPDKIRWVPMDAQTRFDALRKGDIDLLSRNTTFTFSRDVSMGLTQTAIVFFDGQAFMVPARSGIRSVRQLRGKTVCVLAATTSSKNLEDFSRTHDLRLRPLRLESLAAANAAYFNGRCQAYTADGSALASIRATQSGQPSAHLILPEIISKEPQGPMVRRGDEDFAAVVRWVLYGLMEAEEYGVRQSNVAQLRESSREPTVMRLLGKTDHFGPMLGLQDDWLYRAIQAVGNYGEIYARHVGSETPLGLPRGSNQSWMGGGLVFSPPFR